MSKPFPAADKRQVAMYVRYHWSRVSSHISNRKKPELHSKWSAPTQKFWENTKKVVGVTRANCSEMTWHVCSCWKRWCQEQLRGFHQTENKKWRARPSSTPLLARPGAESSHQMGSTGTTDSYIWHRHCVCSCLMSMTCPFLPTLSSQPLKFSYSVDPPAEISASTGRVLIGLFVSPKRTQSFRCQRSQSHKRV